MKLVATITEAGKRMHLAYEDGEPVPEPWTLHRRRRWTSTGWSSAWDAFLEIDGVECAVDVTYVQEPSL
jgi:hypothetical protein